MASNSNKSRASAKKPKTKKRGKGRPAYVPTDEARKVVELMAAHAIPHEEIGRAITPPCSVPTLRTAFAAELARARPRYKGLVAQSMQVHLMGRPAEFDVKGNMIRDEVKPNVAMAIFQAKTVLGQRERVEHTGKDGAPLITPEMLGRLSEHELATLERLLAKTIPDAADDGAGYGSGGTRSTLN